MDNFQLTQVPVSKTGMLIRRPVADVFEAFISPEITTKFWFTKSSGRLEAGRQIQWEWEMYNVSALVTVKVIEQNKRIAHRMAGIQWPLHGGMDFRAAKGWHDIRQHHGNWLYRQWR